MRAGSAPAAPRCFASATGIFSKALTAGVFRFAAGAPGVGTRTKQPDSVNPGAPKPWAAARV